MRVGGLVHARGIWLVHSSRRETVYITIHWILSRQFHSDLIGHYQVPSLCSGIFVDRIENIP